VSLRPFGTEIRRVGKSRPASRIMLQPAPAPIRTGRTMTVRPAVENRPGLQCRRRRRPPVL